MTYIDYLNNFHRWLESNTLPGNSQLLYVKLLDVFNRAGWPKHVQVNNLRIMGMACVSTEKAAISARNTLIESGFITYQKGKKGSPGRYLLSEIHCIQNSTNDSEFDSINDSEFDSTNDSHNKTKNKTKTKTLKESEKRKSAARFSPPSREEIETYCLEADISIDIDHFVDHYTANGWRVGSKPMKDWKAAVRNWKRRDSEFGVSANARNTAKKTTDSSFDVDEFFEAALKRSYGLQEDREWLKKN